MVTGGETEPTIGEVLRAVTRLEARLDKVLDDHEQRLRRVERWVYAVPPTLLLAAASVLGALMRGG